MGLNGVLQTVKDKYRVQVYSFLITFFSGMLIHLYMMTNKFFNYFEMGNILADMSYSQQDTLGLGRWFLPIASNLFTDFSMPVFNGIFALALMSLTVVLLTEMLEIKKAIYRCLFGIIWVSFPGMACIFSFGVNSDAFCLSLCAAVLAVYVTKRWKYGGIAGIVLLSLSLGVYQPYMAMSIAAVFIILFQQVMQKGFQPKKLIRESMKYLLVLIGGFVLYYIILKICLLANSTVLSDYHGINEMTSFTLKGIAKGFVYSYGYFFTGLFSLDYYYTIGRVIWNALGAVVFIICLISLAGKNVFHFGKKQILWICVMVALIPLGLNAGPFLMGDRVGNGVDRYMLFPVILIWGILLKFLETMEDIKADRASVKNGVLYWIGVCSSIMAIIGGTIICNQAYHRMEAMTVTTESFMTRVAARMESTDGWNKDIPVCFVNPRAMISDKYDVEIPKYDELTNLPGTALRHGYSERAIVQYMNVYLHFPVQPVSKEVREKMESSQIVMQMPSYPAADSVLIIDGVMVVKVSEGE